MKHLRTASIRTLATVVAILLAANPLLAQPSAAATDGFNSYVKMVEARLAQQHSSTSTFIAAAAPGSQNDTRLKSGEVLIEEITPPSGTSLPGAMLHHWRGTAYLAGATAADFEHVIRNFNAYPQYYAPQVLQAKLISQHDDQVEATMRIRQKHVITVVMDTVYDIHYSHLDAQHGYSISRSQKISEIADAGTTSEHALSPSDAFGFLWRMNTYWTYEERNGGLYLQVESVSLSRSIPSGLGWVVKPFVESVPRESMEFTLRSTCNAITKNRSTISSTR